MNLQSVAPTARFARLVPKLARPPVMTALLDVCFDHPLGHAFLAAEHPTQEIHAAFQTAVEPLTEHLFAALTAMIVAVFERLRCFPCSHLLDLRPTRRQPEQQFDPRRIELSPNL